MQYSVSRSSAPLLNAVDVWLVMQPHYCYLG